jgi:environmental stress-induced protein Ves
LSLIRHASLPVTPWRNGAGRKADIATGPDWLIGFAFLDGDAPFSDYAGFDRTITLLEGPGFTLSGPGREDLAVKVAAMPTPFDGGWRATCRINGGPCMVLNAMSARARWRHDVAVYAAGDKQPPGHADAVADLLVVLRGEMRIGEESAGVHDAIRIDGGAVAHASADALLCRIRVRPA